MNFSWRKFYKLKFHCIKCKKEDQEKNRQEVRDYLGQPERRMLIQLVDAQNLLQEQDEAAATMGNFMAQVMYDREKAGQEAQTSCPALFEPFRPFWHVGQTRYA